MLNNPIRIGVLGGGMMSQIGHLPFYLGDRRCELVRLAESRPSLVEALGKQVGPGRIIADHQALFDDASIDAIVISAPRSATGPLTLAALESGKHVIAEKPMAHTSDQASRLVDAAARRGLVYAVGFMKRYDPGVQAAKSLFDEVTRGNRLGRLLFARFFDYSNAYAVPPPAHTRPRESRTVRFETWPMHPDWLPERYHGIYSWFLNSASHDVNLLRFFFAQNVELQDARCSNEGSVVATFRANDIPIILEIVKSTAGRWLEGAEFLFERGRIGLSIPSPMAVDRVAEVVLDDLARGLVAQPMPTGAGWCFARQATGFIDALLQIAEPLTTGEEGLADMVLIERIWRRIAEQP